MPGFQPGVAQGTQLNASVGRGDTTAVLSVLTSPRSTQKTYFTPIYVKTMYHLWQRCVLLVRMVYVAFV